MPVSLKRSTVTGTPSRRRTSGLIIDSDTLPLYPVVRIVFPGATSTFTGPMRSVTSAGEVSPGIAAHAGPAATPATADAAAERKPRRVSSPSLPIPLFSEGSTIEFTSIRAYKTNCEGLAVGLKNRKAVDLLPKDGAIIRIHLVKTGAAPATNKKVDASLRPQFLEVVVMAVQIHV